MRPGVLSPGGEPHKKPKDPALLGCSAELGDTRAQAAVSWHKGWSPVERLQFSSRWKTLSVKSLQR